MNNDLKYLNIDIQQNYEQSLIQLTVFLKSSHLNRKVVKSGLIENKIIILKLKILPRHLLLQNVSE